MTNFNFKFLGAWLVIVASITGLQAQNDFTLKGKDEMVPAGVWNDVNGEYINAHGGGIPVSYTHLTLPTKLEV